MYYSFKLKSNINNFCKLYPLFKSWQEIKAKGLFGTFIEITCKAFRGSVFQTHCSIRRGSCLFWLDIEDPIVLISSNNE